MAVWPLTRPRQDLEQQLQDALPSLWRYAFRLERDAAAADDLVQSAVSKALARRHQLDEPSAFRGWMHRIIYTTFLNDRARAHHHHEVSDDGKVLAFSAVRDGPAAALERSRLREGLDAALATLPEPQRQAVLLVDGQGLSFAEAATVLDAPIGTVASRVARGRLALRDLLHDLATEEGVLA